MPSKIIFLVFITSKILHSNHANYAIALEVYMGGHWYNYNIQYIQNMQRFGPPVFTTRVDSTDIMVLALLNLYKS